MSSQGADIVGGKLNIEILSGQGLLARDGGMFSKATSDPYVAVLLSGKQVAATPCIKKTLNPEWNCTVDPIHVSGKTRKDPTLVFRAYDYDGLSADDPHVDGAQKGASIVLHLECFAITYVSRETHPLFERP